MKILLLLEDEKLRQESFQTVEFQFRRLCSTIKNAYRDKSFNESTAQRLSALIFQLRDGTNISDVLKIILIGVAKVLKPTVSEHTMARLEEVATFYGDQKFLEKLYSAPEYEQIVSVCLHYLSLLNDE